MSSEAGKLTDRQDAFVGWYVKLLNATRAAERAGYQGDENTLGVTGHDLLSNPKIRAEVDKRLKASIPSADEVLSRIGSTAMMDVTPYLNDAGMLDVGKLAAAGLGHLVVGIKPGREGTEITLASPQTARKMLARYHRLLDRHLDVDLHTDMTLDPSSLESLAQQIAAAKADIAQQDETE